jgi:hypothetical protein
MAAGTPYSAKNAKVRVNGQVLYAAEWEVTPETNWLDTSNFEGAGFETQVAGLRKCEVTIRGWWDGGRNMHDTPLSIQDGTELANVRCHIADTTSPYWSFPLLDVVGVPVTAQVAEKVMYEFRGKAQGSFTYPTGNVA